MGASVVVERCVREDAPEEVADEWRVEQRTRRRAG